MVRWSLLVARSAYGPRKGAYVFDLGVDVDRCALLVDAGYFYAAGIRVAFGEKLRRDQIRLKDPMRMIDKLVEISQRLASDAPLLRTYWYDAMPGNQLSADQAELALLPSVKLRLGVLNGAGQQKGVDSLIVTDLIDLARHRAVVDAVVLSGDEDIRLGVQLAQNYGIRVHLLGAGDVSKNMSRLLRQEADTVGILPSEWFTEVLEVPGLVTGAITAPTVESVVDCQSTQVGIGRRSTRRVELDPIEGETINDSTSRVVHQLVNGMDERDKEQIRAQIEIEGKIPREFDGRLIASVSKLQGSRRLTTDELNAIRQEFIRAVD